MRAELYSPAERSFYIQFLVCNRVPISFFSSVVGHCGLVHGAALVRRASSRTNRRNSRESAAAVLSHKKDAFSMLRSACFPTGYKGDCKEVPACSSALAGEIF